MLLSRNPGGIRTGPPIKTFGGDAFGVVISPPPAKFFEGVQRGSNLANLFVSNQSTRVETEGEQFRYTRDRCCVEIFTPDVNYENIANKFYRAATKEVLDFSHLGTFSHWLQTLPDSLSQKPKRSLARILSDANCRD